MIFRMTPMASQRGGTDSAEEAEEMKRNQKGHRRKNG
jgi:hypothetical protein